MLKISNEIQEALDLHKGNSIIKVILISSDSDVFCAGADLVDGGWPNEDNLSAGQSAGKNMETAFNPLVKAITQSGKPIVTAINGIAAGGGVGLALSGDIVIAAKSAKFKIFFLTILTFFFKDTFLKLFLTIKFDFFFLKCIGS